MADAGGHDHHLAVMTAGIVCPRCGVDCQASLSTARSSGARIEIDGCDRCGGLWLDGVEVGEAFAALGQHALRIGDLLAAGAKRGHGIGSCPRCHSETLAFPYFEMWLDLCTRCHGMWLDGDEVTAVAQTADKDDGLPAPVPADGYRSRAVAAAKTQTTACVRCNETVPLRQTLITSAGVMCDRCGVAELASPDDDPDLEELRRSLRLGGSGIGGDILAVLGGVGRALVLVLGALSTTRCSHCGCSHRSHCGH